MRAFVRAAVGTDVGVDVGPALGAAVGDVGAFVGSAPARRRADVGATESLVHHSDTITILRSASDSHFVFTHEVRKLFLRTSKMQNQYFYVFTSSCYRAGP